MKNKKFEAKKELKILVELKEGADLVDRKRTQEKQSLPLAKLLES